MPKLLSVLLFFSFFLAHSQMLVTHHPNAVEYGRALSWDRENVALKADVFRPETDDLLPLVIMVPDAFFTLKKNREGAWNQLANDIAAQGYVVVSIDYRQGMNPDIGVLLEDEFVKAITRAVQDLYTAIEYFDLDAKSGSNHWRILPNNTYLFGYSTGAMAVLHATRYFSQQVSLSRVDRLLRAVGGWPDNAKKDMLRSSVRGAVALAGGVIDTMMYAELDRTPLLLIQAEMDSIFPSEMGQMKVAGLPLGMVFGSEVIYRQGLQRQKLVRLLTLEGVDHDLDEFTALDDVLFSVLDFYAELSSMLPDGRRYGRPSQSIITRTDRMQRNELILRIPSEWRFPVHLVVTNGSNEVIWSEQDIRDTHTISIEGWPQGTYIFSFTYGEDTRKVIRFTL
ncbi:MAG: hypothetical protein EA358_02680 [Flavobacteriales bacterium]|nr:MAG: hypothetical protein EA358_02680 [Flavobacteriales bacterium]